LNLAPHDADAAVVRGVELEHHRRHLAGAVDLAGDCEHGGGLACAGRAVEEQVGEAVLGGEALDC